MQEKICVVSKKSMKSEVQKSTEKKSGGKSGTLPYPTPAQTSVVENLTVSEHCSHVRHYRSQI